MFALPSILAFLAMFVEKMFSSNYKPKPLFGFRVTFAVEVHLNEFLLARVSQIVHDIKFLLKSIGWSFIHSDVNSQENICRKHGYEHILSSRVTIHRFL